MTAEDVKKMTTQEKLDAMELLWESLDKDRVPSPEWHKEVLDERRKRIESGEAKFYTIEEARRELGL